MTKYHSWIQLMSPKDQFSPHYNFSLNCNSPHLHTIPNNFNYVSIELAEVSNYVNFQTSCIDFP